MNILFPFVFYIALYTIRTIAKGINITSIAFYALLVGCLDGGGFGVGLQSVVSVVADDSEAQIDVIGADGLGQSRELRTLATFGQSVRGLLLGDVGSGHDVAGGTSDRQAVFQQQGAETVFQRGLDELSVALGNLVGVTEFLVESGAFGGLDHIGLLLHSVVTEKLDGGGRGERRRILKGESFNLGSNGADGLGEGLNGGLIHFGISPNFVVTVLCCLI